MKICKREYAEDMKSMSFAFADGQAPLVCKVSEVPREMLERLAIFGVNHKIGDSFSKNEGPADAREKATELWQAVCRGEWSVSRASTGGIWVAALARLTGFSLEEAKEKWDNLDEKAQKVLRDRADMKKAKAEIELERATEKAEKSDGQDLTEILG